MARVSLRHCAAHAYGLLLGRPLTVIGLCWLPAVFYAEAAIFLVRRIDSVSAVAVPSAGGFPSQFAFLYFVALLAATALFGAVIAVPLARQALGLREELAAAHLVVGARELRLFLALLRYYLLVVGSLALLAVGVGVAVVATENYATAHHLPSSLEGIPLEKWLDGAGWSIAIVWFCYLAIRFGFLLDAVGASESSAKLSRSAQLSRGSFWKIAGTMIVTVLPSAVILVACEMTFGGIGAASGHYTIMPASVVPFAAILAGGLVVIQALSAGAAAGAYSELIETQEQTQDEPVHEDAVDYHHAAPALAFAHRGVVQGLEGFQPILHEPAFAAAEASGAPSAMDVATVETTNLEQHPIPTVWMAPPPEAHFGSDPHDALSPDHASTSGLAGDEGASTALEDAQMHAIRSESVAQDGSATEATALAPEVPTSESVGACGSQAPAFADAAAAEAPGLAAHGGAGSSARIMLPSDLASGSEQEVPDHALNAEFPTPPLDPAGAMMSIHNVFQGGAP